MALLRVGVPCKGGVGGPSERAGCMRLQPQLPGSTVDMLRPLQLHVMGTWSSCWLFSHVQACLPLHAQDAAVLALLASSVVGAACLWPPLRQPAADPALDSRED